MQGTTRSRVYQLGLVVFHGLVVLCILGLALVGQMPEEAAGWLVQPAAGPAGRRRTVGLCVRWGRWPGSQWAALGRYLTVSWSPVLLRSLAVWGLRTLNGGWGPAWVRLAPWVFWLWQGAGVGWPGLRRQAVWVWGAQGLWQVQRLVLVGYLGLALSQLRWNDLAPWGLGLGCLVCQPDETPVAVDRQQAEPQVSVIQQADGSYVATLRGHFTLSVAGDHPFRLRLLVLFLSLLDAPGTTRGSRRTRDGRTPFVWQLQLAEWFGVPQPDISRWSGYWQAAAWADLLSLHSAEVLTAELGDRIIEVCATFPPWGVERVYHYLRQQGVAVTEPQVQQAVQQSGWRRLQETLRTRYDLSAPVLALRAGWLVAQLLGQVRNLLELLEAGQPLPAEVRTTLADLTTLVSATGTPPPPPVKALPWLLRVEQVLLGDWQAVTDGQVCCPACGSD